MDISDDHYDYRLNMKNHKEEEKKKKKKAITPLLFTE